MEHPVKDWSGMSDMSHNGAPMSGQKIPMQLMHHHSKLHSAQYVEIHTTEGVTWAQDVLGTRGSYWELGTSSFSTKCL